METKEIKGIIQKIELKDKADGSGQYTRITIDGITFTCFKTDLKEVLEEGNDVALEYIENGKFKNIQEAYRLLPELETESNCSNVVRNLQYELDKTIESKNTLLQNLKVYETKIKEYQIAIERLKK
jgi:hypothetical protein